MEEKKCVSGVPLAQLGDLLKLIRQNGQLQIIYNIQTVNNLNVGASLNGSGISNITNEITFIEQHDPEVARALEKLYEVDKIKKEVFELSSIIAESYKTSSKDKNKRQIKDKLDSIKTCVEIATALVPFYNIIATKFGFPPIPSSPLGN